MKKCILCACIIGTLFLSACGATRWSEKDLYIYDSDGGVIEEPHDCGLWQHVSLGAGHCDGCREDIYDGVTNNGVAIGDSAIEALSRYNLAGAWYRTNDEWFELKDIESAIIENENIYVFLWFDEHFNSIGRPSGNDFWYRVSFRIKDGEIASYDVQKN